MDNLQFITSDCVKTNLQASMEWAWIFVIGFVFSEFKWILYNKYVINFIDNPKVLSRMVNATSIVGYIFQIVGIFWFIKAYTGL